MKTEVIQIDPENIDYEKLANAAAILKKGGLVVFPTETVYGLGANASLQDAVKGIFAAKGRPSDNPLIVHVSDLKMMGQYIAEPEILNNGRIKALINNFWPGPLTLIFKKSPLVPDVVSAGLDTVGIRMPENIVARELIRLAGTGVAAPSANISGKPSSTLAKHVIDDLSGKVDIIIDSGACSVGLESTVLDITGKVPVILRPGGVTREQIECVLKTDVSCADESFIRENALKNDFTPRAPGMKYKHYAPRGEIIIFQGSIENIVDNINIRVREALNSNLTVGILATDQTLCYYENGNVISLGDRNKPEEIGAALFGALRKFDEIGADIIFAEAINGEGIGTAIMNRLNKAAGYKIINV